MFLSIDNIQWAVANANVESGDVTKNGWSESERTVAASGDTLKLLFCVTDSQRCSRVFTCSNLSTCTVFFVRKESVISSRICKWPREDQTGCNHFYYRLHSCQVDPEQRSFLRCKAIWNLESDSHNTRQNGSTTVYPILAEIWHRNYMLQKFRTPLTSLLPGPKSCLVDLYQKNDTADLKRGET